MKKLYKAAAFAALLMILLVCLTGCGDKPDKLMLEKEDILGTWEKQFEDGSASKDIYVFYENDRYKHEQSDGSYASNDYGEYSISIDVIKIKSSSSGVTREHEVTALDGDKMTWGSGSFKADYVRTEKP